MLKSPIADRRFNILALLSCAAFVATAAAQESPSRDAFADAGRISIYVDLATTICPALAESGTNAFTLAKKCPDQFRSSANGWHNQPRDI